ncbi:MAG: hypothetical protein SGJ18_14780 [Pseudomonadota bacterium]|nr:hypothetical protein [Pseudomonadota bacterium]
MNFIFDIVGGVPALGYTDPNTFPEVLGVTSLEEFFTTDLPITSMHRQFTVGALDGPIDYRLSDYSFISNTNDKGQMEHYLGFKDSSDLKLKLNCTFRK